MSFKEKLLPLYGRAVAAGLMTPEELKKAQERLTLLDEGTKAVEAAGKKLQEEFDALAFKKLLGGPTS